MNIARGTTRMRPIILTLQLKLAASERGLGSRSIVSSKFKRLNQAGRSLAPSVARFTLQASVGRRGAGEIQFVGVVAGPARKRRDATRRYETVRRGCVTARHGASAECRDDQPRPYRRSRISKSARRSVVGVGDRVRRERCEGAAALGRPSSIAASRQPRRPRLPWWRSPRVAPPPSRRSSGPSYWARRRPARAPSPPGSSSTSTSRTSPAATGCAPT